MMKRLLLALCALALVSSTALGAPLTIDADHPLTSDSKKAEFEETGSVSASLAAPDMTLTVASEHDACDIDGFHSDLRNDYFCIQYTEEIERTIRLYIPDEYWHPYLREAVEPVAGDATATFTPAADGTHTAVEVTLTGPGTYAWAINEDASYFAGAKSRTLNRVEAVTGVGVPSSEQWQYIEPDQLAGNESAYVVRAPNGTDSLILEYKTGPEEWATVPDEDQEFADVYYQTKDGVDDRVYVIATTTDPPEIRYKADPSSRTQIGSALREIASVPSRIEAITGIDIPFL